MLVPFDPKIFKEFKHYKLQTAFFEEQFSYIKDYKNLMDLLLKMFNYIPSKRITAEEALQHPFFAEVASEERSDDF